MISIIVPVYNVEAFLPKCLDSLVNQTYRDIEIICVNDGSTDGSLEILQEYAEKDERIKVISRENRGVSESRNEGIEHASGEWLMFVDSDDWLEPNCCERIMTKNEDEDLIIFSYIREFKTTSASKLIFDNQPRSFVGKEIEWLYERLIAPNGKELAHPEKLDSLSTVWGKLYKTSIVRENGIDFISTKKTGTLEDFVFNGKYFNYLQKAYYQPDCLYHYRKTKADSIAYSHKPDLYKQWMHVFEEIKRCSTAMNRSWLPVALERRQALCLFGLGLNIVFSKESWCRKRKMLDAIITSNWYSSAISHLDTSPMPFHWKCFYGAARHRQTWAVLLMLQIINIIINR